VTELAAGQRGATVTGVENDKIPEVAATLARIEAAQRQIGEALLERCCEALERATKLPVEVTLTGSEGAEALAMVAERLASKGWDVDFRRAGSSGAIVIGVRP
jgi:hypothetical protein